MSPRPLKLSTAGEGTHYTALAHTLLLAIVARRVLLNLFVLRRPLALALDLFLAHGRHS